MRLLVTTTLGLLLLGCGTRTSLVLGADGGRVDAGPRVPDAGTSAPDAGLPMRDAGAPRFDAGLPRFDAGRVDAGGFDAGGFDAGGFDAGGVDAGTLEIPRCNRPPEPPGLTAFERLRWAFAADWQGTAVTPRGWSGGPGWTVRVSFRPDGTYSAHRPTEPLRSPFYYDDPMDHPSKVYRLVDLNAAGEGEGRITLRWRVGSTNEGNLERIVMNPSLTHLTFEFWNTWNRRHPRIGPVRYDLRCRE